MAEPKENTYVLTVTVRGTGKRDAKKLGSHIRRIAKNGSHVNVAIAHLKEAL